MSECPGEPSQAARGPDLTAAAVVVLAVTLVSYWRVVNAETFMRLAIGRATASAGPLMAHDPWIYSVPGLRWRNPEWLGDLLLYGLYRAGGESGLVVSKLALLGVGWLALYSLGRRRGGSATVLVGLILLALGGSGGRFLERNDLHLYWLLPAYGLVLEASRRDGRWLWALLGLGVLWANLHGSFGLGWVLVGAGIADALWGPERDRARAVRLAGILAIHPLLPLISPDGWRAYDLLIDHWRHGAVLKATIKEWVPPALLPATLAGLALHLFGMLALASFLPRPNRNQVGGFVVVVTGLLLAHGAQRFFLVFAMLAIPSVAANLRRAGTTFGSAWPARAGVVLLLACGSALAVPAAIAARQVTRAEERPDYPVRAAAWLAERAPAHSRLFGPYTGSQWLMWKAPAVGLYIHPHFSFGADLLVRYLREVLPAPSRFEDEVRRLNINLALVGRFDESGQLAEHLATSKEWKAVFGDGAFAIYARRTAQNTALFAGQ